MDDELRALARRATSGDAEAGARLREARRRAGGPTAVIADVHANAAALRAVLADAEARGAWRVVCLGDLVNFGPDPAECVDLALTVCAHVVRGCAEERLREPPGERHVAFYRAARAWTDERLGPERSRWLRELPLRHEEPGRLFVHGSPRAPTEEYLILGMVAEDRDRWTAAFAETEGLLLVGHTHQPGAYVEGGVPRRPDELDHRLRLQPGRKVIVNVGSVGQPRDGDPRATYVLLEGDEVEWRRVAYDVEATAANLVGTPFEELRMAQRLRRGV